MFDEQTEGEVPSTEKHKDIGWYLAAILEDPLTDEHLRAAIVQWAECEDESTLRLKQVTERYAKDVEVLLVLNKQLRSSLTDAAHQGQVLLDANERLQGKLRKAEFAKASALLCCTLFGFLTAYLWLPTVGAV